MRRLIDDPDAGKQPLEILEQKISVFEKAEHAQVHANARHEPTLLGLSIFRFADLAPEPEVHRGRGEKERSEWRIPRAVKDVTRDHQQIFSRLPRANAPVKRDDDYEEDNESKRIKQHGRSFELCCRRQRSIYASHIEPDLLKIVSITRKTYQRKFRLFSPQDRFVKVAQPFKAGYATTRTETVPQGTKERFWRPDGLVNPMKPFSQR